MSWNTFLCRLFLNRPGGPRGYQVLWVFVLCVYVWYYTRQKENSCMCAAAHSCVRTTSGKVYFYTCICADVTHHTTHKRISEWLTHTTLKFICTIKIQSVSVMLCQFNLCFGSFMWDQSRWQLQGCCSASLGCVGVIVSGKCLFTCCDLRCLGHCVKLSRKPRVDLMQSHREPRIIIIASVWQSATCLRDDKTDAGAETIYQWTKPEIDRPQNW